MKYTLINPLSKHKAYGSNKENPLEAAKEVWTDMAELLKGTHNETFISLIQEGGQLHHVKIEEKPKNGNVDFTMTLMNNDKNVDKKFLKHLKKSQKGGKHRRRSSSSSSSSSDSNGNTVYYFPKHKYNYIYPTHQANIILDKVKYYDIYYPYGVVYNSVPKFFSTIDVVLVNIP